jgi:phosphoribosylglycinamide formyltransferase 1
VLGVLVSGSGTNLQALVDAGLPIAGVASNVRSAFALVRAGQAGLPTAVFRLEDYRTRVERDLAMASWLERQGATAVVCAGYMHLLTPAFLERFPGRVINIHPSLLPAFPGTRAVEEALAAGVRETGVTVHFVDEGADTGPIIAQEPVPIHQGDTPEALVTRLHAVEHRLLPAVARDLLRQQVRSRG